MANKEEKTVEKSHNYVDDVIFSNSDTRAYKTTGDTTERPRPESLSEMDNLVKSTGLYSPTEVRTARFSKFNRFGRLLDIHGKMNPCVEYLFFVKPDLHIVCTDQLKMYDNMKTIKNPNDQNNYKYPSVGELNPQFLNNAYFTEQYETHRQVIKELQYSDDGGNASTRKPFTYLLSSAVASYLSIDEAHTDTIDTPRTMFGTGYTYLRDALKAEEAVGFSLEFVDNKYLDVYSFFKMYTEYHNLRRTGNVTPPHPDYYRYHRLHNTMTIYKFIVMEDMRTILYWACFYGVIPKNCPRGIFGDPTFGSEGIQFSIDFDAAFVADLNPLIFDDFNALMLKQCGKSTQSDTKDKAFFDDIFSNKPSIKPLDLYWQDNINKTDYPNLVQFSHANGELPNTAFVKRTALTKDTSGNVNPHRYKLLWYNIT